MCVTERENERESVDYESGYLVTLAVVGAHQSMVYPLKGDADGAPKETDWPKRKVKCTRRHLRNQLVHEVLSVEYSVVGVVCRQGTFVIGREG